MRLTIAMIILLSVRSSPVFSETWVTQELIYQGLHFVLEGDEIVLTAEWDKRSLRISRRGFIVANAKDVHINQLNTTNPFVIGFSVGQNLVNISAGTRLVANHLGTFNINYDVSITWPFMMTSMFGVSLESDHPILLLNEELQFQYNNETITLNGDNPYASVTIQENGQLLGERHFHAKNARSTVDTCASPVKAKQLVFDAQDSNLRDLENTEMIIPTIEPAPIPIPLYKAESPKETFKYPPTSAPPNPSKKSKCHCCQLQ